MAGAQSERLHRGLEAVSAGEAEHGELAADDLEWADKALEDAQRQAEASRPAPQDPQH
ncbi:hypothetical protein GCM10029976_065330 [Kribbella albertanoniae]|uniref:hypothetical protein n=1 Tax=Kribbella albertanoniae TaxID=1266829 RepID=UPI001404C9F2|nr:hypothetical protein [Kribbella albertanoniae]